MMRISTKIVSVELVKYIHSKVRIIKIIIMILIISHLKDFLHIHALFWAPEFEDFVLNKLYYRLIFL